MFIETEERVAASPTIFLLISEEMTLVLLSE